MCVCVVYVWFYVCVCQNTYQNNTKKYTNTLLVVGPWSWHVLWVLLLWFTRCIQAPPILRRLRLAIDVLYVSYAVQATVTAMLVIRVRPPTRRPRYCTWFRHEIVA